MEKKLKVNFILKGIAVFAFVAFCLLAILAGVTLPFVSNANTADSAVVSVESDSATVSADSSTDFSQFYTTLSNCNTQSTYYGFYISEELYNYLKSADITSPFKVASMRFSANTVVDLYFGRGSSAGASGMTYYNTFYYSPFGNSSFFLIRCDVPFIDLNNVFLRTNGFVFTYISSEFANYTDKVNVFTSLPSSSSSNYGFESKYGIFKGLSSSDFYINLDVAPILPDPLKHVTTDNVPVNGWKMSSSSSSHNIYYLSLFDRYYLNGSTNNVSVNCGWVLDVYPNVESFISFVVFDTTIWKADCDFIVTPDGGLVSNIRNGKFLVAANLLSDFNVYKLSSADESMYLANSNYNNNSYSYFLDSFIAQQDYDNVKVPSDNSLYLKGYQSASDEYRQQGYNQGYSIGRDDGYKTGFSAGDAKGYARGVEAGGNYSFLSLFGAIFDAPIKAIFGGTSTLPAGTKITDSNGNTITLQSTTTVNRAGLLNFNIMGVNLSGFVLALFSLSILVVVIKFALARR